MFDDNEEIHTLANELRRELVFIEKRLRQMSYSGDCAYEKAMTRTYEKKALDLRNKLEMLSYEIR